MIRPCPVSSMPFLSPLQPPVTLLSHNATLTTITFPSRFSLDLTLRIFLRYTRAR